MAFTAGQVLTAAQLNTFAPSTKVTLPDGAVGAPALAFTDDTDTGIYSVGANQINIATGGTARISVMDDGDVGIGTGAPAAKLHIVDTGEAIRMERSGGYDTYGFQHSAGSGIEFRNFTDTRTELYFDGSGQLGIGNTAPETPLTIVAANRLGSTFTGTVDGEGLRVDQSDYSAGNYVSLVEASYSDGQTQPHVRIGAMFDGSGSHLAFGTSNNFGNGITNTALFIDEAGKVGIGTTSPTSALDITQVNPTLTINDSDGVPGGSITAMLEFEANNTVAGQVGMGTSAGNMISWANDGNYYCGTRSNDKTFIRTNDTDRLTIDAAGDATFTGTVFLSTSGDGYLSASPPTGTGNDAEWAAPLGVYVLRRNSSLAAEKENITADLGEHLTADMIDSVTPKLWNRLNSPGYPEIGPLAEDLDAISPFLAARGTDAENVPFLTGINKTAYLSLLVLAVKDLRARVATLEG